MPIPLSTLANAAYRYREPLYRSMAAAKGAQKETAFLCHSHADAEYVKGFVQLLNESGWSIYVDWLDTTMPTTPNRVTAQKIQEKIRSADFFIFLATRNSTSSKWCPWELGYADGVKATDSIFVVSTNDSYGTYGTEYLELYRRIEFSNIGDLAAWRPGTNAGGTYLKYL